MRNHITDVVREAYDSHEASRQINSVIQKELPQNSPVTIKDAVNKLLIKGTFHHSFHAAPEHGYGYPRVNGEVLITVTDVLDDNGNQKDFGILGKKIFNELQKKLPTQFRTMLRKQCKNIQADKHQTLNEILQPFHVEIRFVDKLLNFGTASERELPLIEKLIKHVQPHLTEFTITNVSNGGSDASGYDFFLHVDLNEYKTFSVYQLKDAAQMIRTQVDTIIQRYARRKYSYGIILKNIGVRC
jgi:hypothetical protein